jgi:hypothetical protein
MEQQNGFIVLDDILEEADAAPLPLIYCLQNLKKDI